VFISVHPWFIFAFSSQDWIERGRRFTIFPDYQTAEDIMNRMYKVVEVKENALSSLFLGASRMPIQKMEEAMNEYGKMGWEMVFMVIEQQRLLFFWTREVAVLTFTKPM
jgi:hypothetical protein